MVYQTFQPRSSLAAFVKCYWHLEVPAEMTREKQRIVPDGCIEMAFILGDDVQRYISAEDYVYQPRAMVIGQITEPFYIQPTGYVNTFAVRFYPYGFTHLINTPLKDIANKDIPIAQLFGAETADELTKQIIEASTTESRINIVEDFLSRLLHEQSTIDHIVQNTVDTLLSARGNKSVNELLNNELSKRRQLERKFLRHIGISPKQLGKVVRLQAAMKILLGGDFKSLTAVAYESQYYDQAHFIKDFKEFTGITPQAFLGDNSMILSSVFYK